MGIYSPIAYPGAKNKVALDIIEKVPDGVRVWVEPFLGGGSVTIAFLQSMKANAVERVIVNDLNWDVYNFFLQLKKNAVSVVDSILELVAKMKFKYNSLKDSYSDKKVIFKMLFSELSSYIAKDEIESASLFYLIQNTSFSGLGKGSGVSYERFESLLNNFDTFDERVDRVLKFSKLFNQFDVEIYNKDFVMLFKDDISDDEGVFIFLDPPYYNQEKSGLYGEGGRFHKNFKHEELCKICSNLRKAKFLMTLDDSIEVRKMYRFFNITEFCISYTLAGDKYREESLNGEELFISNYEFNIAEIDF